MDVYEGVCVVLRQTLINQATQRGNTFYHPLRATVASTLLALIALGVAWKKNGVWTQPVCWCTMR